MDTNPSLIRFFVGLRQFGRARVAPRIILLIGRRDAIERRLVSFFHPPWDGFWSAVRLDVDFLHRSPEHPRGE
jgi:hypothetical protein